jgi:hypothetical protein
VELGAAAAAEPDDALLGEVPVLVVVAVRVPVLAVLGLVGDLELLFRRKSLGIRGGLPEGDGHENGETKSEKALGSGHGGKIVNRPCGHLAGPGRTPSTVFRLPSTH